MSIASDLQWPVNQLPSNVTYSAAQQAQLVNRLFGTDGIWKGYENELAITETSPASASVQVDTGLALVDGRLVIIDTADDLEVSTNTSGQDRIDLVVAYFRDDQYPTPGGVKIVAGTPAASPVPPSVTQTRGTEWQVPLYYIYAANGFTTIKNVDIRPAFSYGNVPAGPPVGQIIPYIGASAPSDDWLLCTGGTIGPDGSNATLWESSLSWSLYSILWDLSDSDIVIYTSGGSPSTRGSSALADWRAYKPIAIPDMRGRLPLGQDDMGGSSANRVTNAVADRIGGASGNETVTLSESQLPAHNHQFNVYDGGAGDPANAAAPASTYRLSRAAVNIYHTGGSFNDYLMDGTVGDTGSGAAVTLMNPYLTVNYLLRAKL